MIGVVDIEPGSVLVLQHDHDGRDLEMQYAKKVFEYIQELWGDEVQLYTLLEGELWEF